MPKQPKKARAQGDHTTVKVPMKAYNQAHQLLQQAAVEGWHGAFGIDRTDVPTLGAIIEEGLKALSKTAGKPT
jgi:hypothetical protein